MVKMRKSHLRLCPTRAIAYLRVSTDKQTDSPDVQRARIELFAASQGIEVVEWHTEIVSGSAELDSRPVLLSAIAALKQRNAGVFLTSARDRLARSALVMQSICHRIDMHSAKYRSADGQSDNQSLEGRFSQAIQDAAAEYERQKISERTRNALALKKTRGELTGRAPFGFQVGSDGVHLERNESEQSTIAEILKLSAQGFSQRQIQMEISSKLHVGRTNRPLSQPQIFTILKNNSARKSA